MEKGTKKQRVKEEKVREDIILISPTVGNVPQGGERQTQRAV